MIPNIRLITERQYHHWSQQDVADRAGTTRNNVSRWERGITSPDPHLRQRLCQLFEKSAEDLGLCSNKLKATTQTYANPKTFAQQMHIHAHSAVTNQIEGDNSNKGSIQPIYLNLPQPRNPLFTGREAILQSLHKMLKQQHVANGLTQSCALNGLSGVGKTQIALEYVYRYATEYTTVFWIHADTQETLLASFMNIAKILSLPEDYKNEPHQIVHAVTQWLNNQKNWLLVFDNVEDLNLLSQFLPASHGGSQLLTTRLQAVRTFAQQIKVEPMTSKDSIAFLARRAKLLPSGTSSTLLSSVDAHVARSIVEVMDGLPLALDQAGAYIEETQCSLEDYLHWYRQQRATLLERRGCSSHDHPTSVRTTLLSQFQQIEERHLAAAEVLQLCAFLAPDAIPEEVITVGFSPGSKHLRTLQTNPWLLNEAIAVLGTYSLLHRDSETKTLSLHQLVQAVLQDRLSRQEQEEWLHRIITALNRVFPEVETATLKPEARNRCEQLIPHVLQCAKHISSYMWKQANEALAMLLSKAGAYLAKCARYQEAEPLLKRASQIGEQMLGAKHPHAADLYDQNIGKAAV